MPGRTDHGGVARVVEIADRQRDVIERGQRVAVFGLKAGHTVRHVCFGVAVAAVLGDHQAPAQGVQRLGGISVAEGVAVGVKRKRERIRVVGGLGGLDQAVRGGPRLLTATGDRQCEDQVCPGDFVGVAAASEPGAHHSTHRSGWPMARYQRRAPPRGRTAPLRGGHCRSPAGRHRL